MVLYQVVTQEPVADACLIGGRSTSLERPQAAAAPDFYCMFAPSMQAQRCGARSCLPGHKQIASSMRSSSSRKGRSLRCRIFSAAAAAHALRGCKLTGSGSSVPESVLSNADLEKLVETNDEWIATRTGIRRRHVMAAGESLSTHAAAAAERAMEMAGVDAADIDVVLLATSSPDDLFGSACQVGTPSRILLAVSQMHPRSLP